MALLGFFAIFNFAEVSDQAITRGFGSETTLNIVLGIGSAAMLATTVASTNYWRPTTAPARPTAVTTP